MAIYVDKFSDSVCITVTSPKDIDTLKLLLSRALNTMDGVPAEVSRFNEQIQAIDSSKYS